MGNNRDKLGFDTVDRISWIKSKCSPGDRILDIGSANGWVWKGSGLKNVTLLDINAYDPNQLQYPFLQADAHALPFENNSFDITCLNEIIEHADNHFQVLREAVRVARKKVIITTPYEHMWPPQLKPFVPLEERLKETGLIKEEQMKRDNPGITEITEAGLRQGWHRRYFTESDLEKVLSMISLPYHLETLSYDGWAFGVAEIYKDKNIPLAEQADQILSQRLATQGAIIKPSPAPSAVGHIKYDTLPQPRSLRIDTFAYCQAKCLFCRYNTLTRPKGKMDMKLLEHILDDAATWLQPLEEIVPIHYGELFLNPEWYGILKLIERKLPQTAIVLPTNGSMLDPATVVKLTTIRTLRILNISVNAYFAETYEQIMGLKAETILKIKEAIRYLKVLMSPITVWLSMVYDPAYQTEKEKDLFEQEWQPYGIVKVHPASFCRDYRKPTIPSKIPCRSIFIDFVVLWDGRVAPCCWDSNGEIIVGNVTEQKILDVWHGEAMNRLREVHNQGRRDEIELCSLCSFS